MNDYEFGNYIYERRCKAGMTQSEMAEQLGVTNKAVSKWETGKGFPDISLLEPLAKALLVSVTELLSGNTVTNQNVSSNVARTRFYV